MANKKTEFPFGALVREIDFGNITGSPTGISSITVYIDPLGNDETGDGTLANPFFSLHRAVKAFPHIISNCDMIIKCNPGVYDFSALGNLVIEKLFQLGNSGGLYIYPNQTTIDACLTVLDSGTVTSSTENQYTDSSKSWVPDNLYAGKWIKEKTVKGTSTLGTESVSNFTSARMMPIYSSTSNTIECAFFADNNRDIDTFDIVDVNIEFQFGTNHIFLPESKGIRGVYTSMIYWNLNKSGAYFYALYHPNYGLGYYHTFLQCRINARSMTGAFYPQRCYIDSQYSVSIYGFSYGVIRQASSSNIFGTGLTTLSSSILVNDAAKGTTYAMSLGSNVKPSLGGKLKFVNWKSTVYGVSRLNPAIEVSATLFFDSTDFFMRYSTYTGVLMSSSVPTFYNEPAIGRLTTNGTSESTTYFDPSVNLDVRVLSKGLGTYVMNELEIFDTGAVAAHGVPTPADITVSYVPGTQTITIAPTGASFDIWRNGRKYTFTSSTDLVHNNTTGAKYVFLNASGALEVRDSIWDFYTEVPITYVVYNLSLVDGWPNHEEHGVKRNLEWHKRHHLEVGAIKKSGFGISGYTLNSAVDSDITYTIAAGVVADEDLESTLGVLADGGPYTVFYRSGASGDWAWTKTRTVPFEYGTYIQYNEWTGATWKLTDLVTNRWVNYYVFGVPSIDTQFQYLQIPGQAVHTTLAAAQAESVTQLTYGSLPLQEFVPLYKITFRTNAGYGSTGKARIEAVTALVGTSIQVTGAVSSNHSSLTGLTNDDHLQYVLNQAQNCGIVGTAVPTLTDNGDGTFDIASCQAALRSAAGQRANLYTIAAAAGLTPTNGVKSYVIVNYNSGSPEYQLTTNVELIDEATIVPVHTIFRNGTEILKIYDGWDTLATGLGNKLHQRLVKTNRFSMEEAYPAILSESATRVVNISACKVWHGAVRSNLDAFASDTDRWCFWYHVAGVWTVSEATTQYNNSQYDDGTDLVALGSNRYNINWIYRIETGAKHAAYVLSDAEYKSLSDALEATPPAVSSLPESIQALGFLVGRIIVYNGATTAAKIESAYYQKYSFTVSDNFLIKQENTFSISGGAVDVEMSSKDHIFGDLALTSDVTINNPTGIVTGAQLTINVTQDAIGGWNISWDTYYTGDNGSIPAPTGTGLKSTTYKFQAVSETKLVLIAAIMNH